MTQSKKHKLILGTCIPAALLGVGGLTAGIVLATQKTNPVDPFDPVSQIKLTFDAGTGAFAQNTTTTKIVDKNTSLSKVATPVVTKEGAIFAGWKNSTTGQMQRDDVLLTSSTTLVATYSNEIGNSHTITFEKGSANLLVGNLTVAVADGKEFVMVNKPQATKANCLFKYWALSTTPTVEYKGSEKITEDITLVPCFSETTQITFSTSGKQFEVGETTGKAVTASYKGQVSPYYDKTSTWGNVNKPEVSSGALYFEYFCTDADCKNKIDDTTSISTLTSTTVYPRFTSAPTGNYCIMNAVVSTTGATITGNTAQAVLKTKTAADWDTINKPTATKDNYELSGWQWCKTNSTTETDWKAINDATTPIDFANNDSLYIRPVMTPKATGVILSGASEAIVDQTDVEYKAWIEGSSTDTVAWKLEYTTDKTVATPSWTEEASSTPKYGKLTSTPTTQGTAAKLSIVDQTTLTGKEALRITASSATDSTKFEQQIISLSLPTVNSDRVWYHDADETNPKWWSVSTNELTAAKGTSSITPKDVNNNDGTATTLAAFNQSITLGDEIKVVPNNFLAGAVAMEGIVDLNNATVIEDNFMEGCEKFDQKITNLEKVTKIGNGFLAYCKAYNQDTTLTACTEIGEDFMLYCEGLTTKTVSIPAVTKIGDCFLAYCKLFNSDITFPESLITTNSIGDFCMRGCSAFTSKITVNCVATAFTPNAQSFSGLATGDAIRATGFTVDGTAASAFKTTFPAANDSTNVIFRSYAGEWTVEFTNAPATIDKGSSGTFTATITAGPDTASAIAYSIKEDVSGKGITISNNTVSVAVDATAGTYTVVATVGTSTAEVTFTVSA